MAEHVDVVDSERHEPKGASTASANQVLKSDGDSTTSFGFVDYSEVTNTPTIPTIPQGVAVVNAPSDADLVAAVAKINELLNSLRAANIIGN